jgi:hypothetical protein
VRRVRQGSSNKQTAAKIAQKVLKQREKTRAEMSAKLNKA